MEKMDLSSTARSTGQITRKCSTAFWESKGVCYPRQPPSALQIRSSSKGSLAVLREQWFATPINWPVSSGREHIIAKVLEKFWIPLIRKAICSVLSRCIVCKKFHAKPLAQQMAPLPTSRMMTLSASLFLLRSGPFWPLVRQAWREYSETLLHPVQVPEHTFYSSRFNNLFYKIHESLRQGGPTEVWQRYQFCGRWKRAERKSRTVEPTSDWARAASVRVQVGCSATYCFEW